MILLHAFQETKNKNKGLHLKNWLGYPPNDDRDIRPDGSYIACHCGGRLVPFSKTPEGDIDIACIYHIRAFKEIDEN